MEDQTQVAKATQSLVGHRDGEAERKSEWETIHKWREPRGLWSDIVKAKPSEKGNRKQYTSTESAMSSGINREHSERKREGAQM